MSRHIQHEASVWQSGLIVYPAYGNRQYMCGVGGSAGTGIGDSVDSVELCWLFQ